MMALNKGGYRWDTWTSGICVLMFVYYYMFEFFNNPLESTLVFSLLCYSWTSLCCFYFLKALALKHVPWLWTNDLHKFGFSDIYIYICDVFSSIYIIVWESFIFCAFIQNDPREAKKHGRINSLDARMYRPWVCLKRKNKHQGTHV